ncbi:unnamed protein product [Diamesa hyperborea]
MKPATTRFDPLRECFDPVTKLVPTNRIASVKEGNKKIDASVIAKLKAENAQKVKIAPITSFKKIEGTKRSSSNEEDPFTRRRTKPKMASGGETVQNQEKQQPETRLPLQELVENISLPIEKTLEDEIKTKFEKSLPRPEMTWAFEDPIEKTDDEIRKKFEKSLPRPKMTWAFEDPIEKTLEDEIRKKFEKPLPRPEMTCAFEDTVQNQEEADHQFNPTPPQYTNKRAPEPLEQEPERKKIKLTIIIERRSEGENSRKSETYRIKRE